MKKTFFNLTLAIVVSLTSCQKQELIISAEPGLVSTAITPDPDRKLDDIEKSNLILYPHLSLAGKKYILNISKDDAVKLGVLPQHYDDAMRDLETTNVLISSVKEDENHLLLLSDPQENTVDDIVDLGDIAPRSQELFFVRPTSEKQNGRIETYNQAEKGLRFFAARGSRSINYSCRGKTALTPAFTVRHRALGSWKGITFVGSSLFSKQVNLGLDASALYVDITFQTTDAKGGTCFWSCI